MADLDLFRTKSREELWDYLSPEQRYCVSLVLAGENVFFTGSAGTGKSFLLKYLVKILPRDTTYVCALTGIAASNIQGKTLHSFAGIGLGQEPRHILAKKASHGFAGERWRECRVLIVDEVSMWHGELFDKVEYIARYVRDNQRPFGGIQLVFCGDFFQLPPVDRSGGRPPFCFETQSWAACIPRANMVELTQVFRQTDAEFVELLRQVRFSCVTEQTLRKLAELSRPLRLPQGIEPTRLYSKNVNVDAINIQNLRALPGESVMFDAIDGGIKPELADTLAPYPKQIELRVGAQVINLRNDVETGLVNGSRGVVLRFEGGFPVVRFTCMLYGAAVERELTITHALWEYTQHVRGERDAKALETVLSFRKQLPLKLAWALTIHKSQGMTIDYLEVRCDDVFDYGQAYVGLSRARTLDGLRVLGFDRQKFYTSEVAVEFSQLFQPIDPATLQRLAAPGSCPVFPPTEDDYGNEPYADAHDVQSEPMTQQQQQQQQQQQPQPRRQMPQWMTARAGRGRDARDAMAARFAARGGWSRRIQTGPVDFGPGRAASDQDDIGPRVKAEPRGTWAAAADEEEEGYADDMKRLYPQPKRVKQEAGLVTTAARVKREPQPRDTHSQRGPASLYGSIASHFSPASQLPAHVSPSQSPEPVGEPVTSIRSATGPPGRTLSTGFQSASSLLSYFIKAGSAASQSPAPSQPQGIRPQLASVRRTPSAGSAATTTTSSAASAAVAAAAATTSCGGDKRTVSPVAGSGSALSPLILMGDSDTE